MTNGSYPHSIPETLDEVWNEVIRFNDKHFPNWKNEDWRLISNALAGEVGEVCDKTKHAYGGGTNPHHVNKINAPDIAEECFDSFVYIILLVGAMGYNKERFIVESKLKIDQLYKRMGDHVGKL